jgi:hypothetical protein
MSKIIKQSLENFQQFIESNTFDIFICSSSFEKRCMTIPEMIGNQIKNIIICHYNNNYQEANSNYSELAYFFKNPFTIPFEKNDPLTNIDNLASQLSKIKKAKHNHNHNILIDITTLTREMIFIIIYFFKNVPTVNSYNVTFIYNPAEKYEKWLSKGVRDIRSVLGYSGLFLPNKKLALILLVGFEQERAKKIIDTFEPSKVFLGHASVKGAITKELQKINKSVFEELKSMLSIDIVQFEFSCITPEGTKRKINEIIKSLKKEYNIVIASLNNKISTIGVALSALENPEVQICYPMVNQYNIENYSVSKNEIFLIDINS